MYFFLYPLNTAFGADLLNSKVIRIIDGDSIVVEGKLDTAFCPISVRLQFIDTPEMTIGSKKNPHGNAAKEKLEEILNKERRIKIINNKKGLRTDGHGRVLAIIFTKEGVCIQEEMIKQGHSVYWQKFGQAPDPFHKRFSRAQKYAQERQLGLWKSDPDWMQKKSKE